MYNKIGFIGFGKMANAIAKGIINSDFIKKENVFAFDVNKEALIKSTQNLSINPVFNEDEMLDKVDCLILATKPFVVDDVLDKIKSIKKETLIISILAGIPIQRYELKLKESKIIRVMPNTPAMVNEGMSVLAGGNLANREDMNFALNLFSKLGKSIELDETKLDAVTAVSGSGPAFYYYIIDLIAKAGNELGLKYEDALLLSTQTALGAAKMILNTKMSPDELITAVTTPNGTTAEGNKVLINSDIKEVLRKTVFETNKRSIELGKK